MLTKDGETVHNIVYQYDVLNRLVAVEQDGDTIAAYEYDANGNRTRLTYPVTGTATTYTYNLANWVTGMTSKTGKKTLTSYAYTYYASGNRQSETDKSRAVTTYVYDDLGRLTKESETGGLTVKYTYNSAGNRTKMAVTGTETYTTTYTYDKNNRLTQEKKTTGSTAATTVYAYDANGNLIQKSDPNGAELYEYNGFNQLTVLKQGGTATTYAYNASGIRTAKRTANGGTYYLLDGGNVIAEYTDGVQTAFSVWGINLISRKSGGTTKFYVQDAHGDVVCVTENTGVPIRYYAYDAFGNEKNPDSTDSNPFRYCGEYFDKETGTYYLRARYYDPAIGRFTQQDTHWSPANAIYGDNPRKINERQDALGLSTYAYAPEITAIMQSGNLYVYCVNSPCMYTDQNGESLTLAYLGWIAFGVLVGGVIGAITNIAGQLKPENSQNNLDWTSVAISAAAGAVSGGLGASKVKSVGQVVGNAVISGVSSLLHDLLCEDEVTLKQLLGNAAINTLKGAITGFLSGPGLQANVKITYGKLVSDGNGGLSPLHISFWSSRQMQIIKKEFIKGIGGSVLQEIFSGGLEWLLGLQSGQAETN